MVKQLCISDIDKNTSLLSLLMWLLAQYHMQPFCQAKTQPNEDASWRRRDEAACGQARAADGSGILAAQLYDVASRTDAESGLWDSSRIDDSASQLVEALTTLVEVHTESQVGLLSAVIRKGY
jgi:hypothetical protein